MKKRRAQGAESNDGGTWFRPDWLADITQELDLWPTPENP
jgi:hypothetical protein